MALHEKDEDTASRFDLYDGYYSVRFGGVEFARFAPSNVWSDYAKAMSSVSDFSYAFVPVNIDEETR